MSNDLDASSENLSTNPSSKKKDDVEIVFDVDVENGDNNEKSFVEASQPSELTMTSSGRSQKSRSKRLFGQRSTASAGSQHSTSSQTSFGQRFSRASTAIRVKFQNKESSVSIESRGGRTTHLRKLFMRRKYRDKMINQSTKALGVMVHLAEEEETSTDEEADTMELNEEDEMDSHVKEVSEKLMRLQAIVAGYERAFGNRYQVPLEVRLQDFSYSVVLQPDSRKIKTVFNSSFLYDVKKFYKKYFTSQDVNSPQPIKKIILDKINLVIEPRKSYLVLGPPGCGKTSLLKAISGRIRKSKRRSKSVFVEGDILYNGLSMDDAGDKFCIQNAVEYIDQYDRHAPRLTVDETFEFAYQCNGGSTIREKDRIKTEEQRKWVETMDKQRFRPTSALIGLGLEEVKDTFVGDTTIRGVSGGQRRRVTVGEMMQEQVPVLCGDEISTGLDSKSTYETVELLVHFSRASGTSRVISLLQPSPETVSLFDEVILLSKGRILYTGPILEVEEYFATLGFTPPKHMDVADFLQQVSSEDGVKFYSPTPEKPVAPSLDELVQYFATSQWGSRVSQKLSSVHRYSWDEEENQARSRKGEKSYITDMEAVKQKYANNFIRSTYLVFIRFLTLWRRDKRVIVAGAAKNILMGVSVGGVFANTTGEFDLLGALFQAGLFIMLGAMQSSAGMIADRPVFQKHHEANFYSSIPFVVGRTLSTFPQTISDTIMFGTLLYYIIGLGDRDDPVNFFIYLSILITFAFTMQQQLAFFASFASPGTLQSLSSITMLYFILFGGFIMAPEVIPFYYKWAYWINPFAWAYRALVVNEFRSSRWENPDEILDRIGFVSPESGEPFGKEWIGLSFLFNGLYFVVMLLLSALGLNLASEKVQSKSLQFDDKPERHLGESSYHLTVPFVPVTLSFHDICYDVQASTGKETLRLLNNVNGVFKPGRMTALMGSSGAGKTTLMDVIALRKNTGEVSGGVLLNGWPQETVAFRRASGYVEQFDVQSPELTVRETVWFSAKLRLDQDLITDEASLRAFVARVLESVGIREIENALVGTDSGMGLTFEQKKLLSIAVELAASPSIIFLDEPTSGLDSRSAMQVVTTLRRIADENRTICATIHQPSSSVFEMFDDLLLLKKGGHVVYHGELGPSSSKLVGYFEGLGAPKIAFGENPANYMLDVMARTDLGDLAERWIESENGTKIKEELDESKGRVPDPSKKLEYETEFAAPRGTRSSMITRRLRLIYWRSPAYNLARLTVSAVIAFVLGSVFITKRRQTYFTESDATARFAVVFLSFILLGIMAILSVIPVMGRIRDMFYRHRASGMYDSASLGWALGSAEKLFIVTATAIFVCIFQATGSLNDGLVKGMVGFWGFFTFNFAIYSYFGQAFVALVPSQATAMILSSVFIGLNNFFSGLIVRPQLMIGGFYALPYYICPGHYVYEGLIVSLYRDDNSIVVAEPGSEFFDYLQCAENDPNPCEGTINQYIHVFFGGDFGESHISRNGFILGFILVLTRLSTWLALKYIKY